MTLPPTEPATALISPPETEPETEELRVAMALNGGVSLAVWMGGCAVELDRARRAGTGKQKTPRIYDDLCGCFGRRLVIDILTGASAGGINGALLGAAMVKGRELDPGFVRGSWLDLGDLSQLLHDPADTSPTALMDGKMFHEELLSAFKAVLGTDSRVPGYGECSPLERIDPFVPDLDVTMTDVIGVERRFRDTWGAELVAREHRPRFKFRERAHYTASALAGAARTSASFPVAFDPWRVDGNARILAGLSNPTYGIDGGLLDNAPIRAALDLIPSKSATSRVRRYICYLNGDPTAPGEEAIEREPSLREVGSHMVNLPRNAPLVDHLYAIQRATERPKRTQSVQLQLLGMDIDELAGVATALFESYCERRTRQSLEELLTEPGDAIAARDLLDQLDGQLPWIPRSLATPEPKSWDWGIRPAQRILHLLLDLLRPAIDTAAGPSERGDLLKTRGTIDRQLSLLGAARADVVEEESQSNPSRFDEEAALERLHKAATTAAERSEEAYAAVTKAAEALRAATTRHPTCFETNPAKALFGDAGAGEQPLPTFFRRVLSIEVIRRAFSAETDIESAEELSFVQLTPAAPSPIFSSRPLGLAGPGSAPEKLTGVGLGHFAGFYRRSWRANDFMWGRLDAAARIVDLLLDAPSGEVGWWATDSPETRIAKRSEALAEALLREGSPEQRWLVREALDEAAGLAGAKVDTETAAKPAASTEEPGDDLRKRLEAKIESELRAAESETEPNRLPFTRAVFQRAAQLEVLREELPVVQLESSNDRKLGSSAAPLDLDEKECGSVQAEIKAVRSLYENGSSMPQRLTDPEEIVSDLGLRTLTHAGFVALAAIRTAGAPLSKYLGVVRAPLLAIAGTVAESRLYRMTTIIGFWVAALFLTSRLITAEGPEDVPLTFSSVWTWTTLTALVALLVVVSLAAVPAVRAWRGVRRPRNALFALALIGTGVGVAAALAATVGDLDFERLLFAPGADKFPNLVLLAPLFAIGAVSGARLPLPSFLGKIASGLEKVRGKAFTCVLLIAGFGLLGVYAGESVIGAAFGGDLWRTIAGVLALVGAPLAAALAVTIWKGRPAEANERRG